MKRKPYFLITCEHADNMVPSFIKSLDLNNTKIKSLLSSHNSYDMYALTAAKSLKSEFDKMGFDSDLISYPYTRLLIDANRTKNNKGFYSKLNSRLSEKEAILLENEYDKYLKKALNLINKNINKKNIFLFSIHSFTPVFKGKKRKLDVGLLFRNKITKELDLASKIQNEIKKNDSKLKVFKNNPYRGHTDCFSNYILDQYLNMDYINGVFFEFNQQYLKKNLDHKMKIICQSIVKSSL